MSRDRLVFTALLGIALCACQDTVLTQPSASADISSGSGTSSGSGAVDSTGPATATQSSTTTSVETGGSPTTGSTTGADTGEPPPDDGVVMPKGTSVYVQIVDPTDTPIPGARITFGKGPTRRTVTTSSLGTYLFEDIQVDDLEKRRFAAEVRAADFAPASTGFILSGGAHIAQKVTLLPLGKRRTFDPRVTSTLVDDNLKVTIPAWGVVDAHGAVVVDKIDATIVRIDADSSTLLYAPAPFETMRDDQAASVALNTLGMFDISLWRGDEPLQLRPSASIDLEFTLSPKFKDAYKAGDKIPRWTLDLADAYWRDDGFGQVVAVGDDLVWRSQTSHLSWFNLDFVDGCVDCPKGMIHMCLQVQVRSQDANTPPPKFYPYHVTGIHKGWIAQKQLFTDPEGKDCLDLYYGYANDEIIVRPGLAPNFTALPQKRYMPQATPATLCDKANACPLLEFYVSNVCVPGSHTTAGCEDKGPYTLPNLDGKGSCLSARRYCKVDGTGWESKCTEHVYPKYGVDAMNNEKQEFDWCEPLFGNDANQNQVDTNCDGAVNPLCNGCIPNATYGCYSGNPTNYRITHDNKSVIHQDPVTKQTVVVPFAQAAPVPMCKEGTLKCNGSGSGFTGDCSGQQHPLPSEDCSTGNDDNCDGSATCEGMTVHTALPLGGPGTKAPDAIYDAVVDRAGTPDNSADDGVIVLYRGSDASLSDSCLQKGPDPELGVYLARFALYPNPNSPKPGLTCQWRRKLGSYTWSEQTKFQSSLGNSDGVFHDDFASLSLNRDDLILVTGTATAPILGTGGVGPGCPKDEILAPNGKSDVYLGMYTLATGQCRAQYLVSGAGNSEQYGLAIAAGRTWTPMDEKLRDDFWALAHVVGGLTLPGCNVQTPNSLVLAKMYESGALYCEKTLTLPMDPGTQVSPFGLRVRFDGNGLVDRGWLGVNFTGKIDGIGSTGGDDALMYVLSGSMAKAKPPLRIYGDGAQFVHTFYVGPGELLIGGRAEESININNNILVLDNWIGHQPFWAVIDHDLLHLQQPAFATAPGSGAGAVRGGFSSFNEVHKHMYLGFQVNDAINLGGGEYKVADDSWDMFVGRLNPAQPKHVWSEGVGAGPNNSAGNQTLQYLLPVGEGLFVMVGTYQVALGVTTPPLEGHPSHDRGFIALAGG